VPKPKKGFINGQSAGNIGTIKIMLNMTNTTTGRNEPRIRFFVNCPDIVERRVVIGALPAEGREQCF
jgi:hypothetical protein